MGFRDPYAAAASTAQQLSEGHMRLVAMTLVLLATGYARAQLPDYATNGVTRNPNSKETWHTSGGDEARRFIETVRGGESKAEDDSHKPWLSVIGTLAEQDAVRKDIEGNGVLGSMDVKNSFRVNYFTPDSWQATGVNLGTGGKPDIVIQQPMDVRGYGRVVYRQRDYQGGEARLARGIQSIGIGSVRKPNPDYDPNHDPGLGGLCPLGFTQEHWPLIGTVALALIFAVFHKPKEVPQ